MVSYSLHHLSQMVHSNSILTYKEKVDSWTYKEEVDRWTTIYGIPQEVGYTSQIVSDAYETTQIADAASISLLKCIKVKLREDGIKLVASCSYILIKSLHLRAPLHFRE